MKEETGNRVLAFFMFLVALIVLLGFMRPYVARAVVATAQVMWSPVLKMPDPLFLDVKRVARAVHRLSPQKVSELSWDDLMIVHEAGNRLASIVVGLGFVGFGVRLFLTSVTWRFSRTYTLRQLLARNAAFYPAARVAYRIVDRHRESAPVAPGVQPAPWERAETSIEFAIRNRLLRLHGPDGPHLNAKPSQERDVPPLWFDREAARAVFIAQLGPSPILNIQRIPDCLPPLRRMLFVYFMAFGLGGGFRKRVLDLLMQVTDRPATPWTQAEESLWRDALQEAKRKHDQDHTDGVLFYQVLQSSAWEPVLLVNAFDFAKRKGLLVPADFLWIKPLDRTLWYALNQGSRSMGRQRAWDAAAGIRAHHDVELAVGRPVLEPDVQAAVVALEESLWETGWLENPPPELKPRRPGVRAHV